MAFLYVLKRYLIMLNNLDWPQLFFFILNPILLMNISNQEIFTIVALL